MPTDSALRSRVDGLQRSVPLSLYRLGLLPNRDIAAGLNSIITSLPPGTEIEIPPLNPGDQWLVDEPILWQSGISLRGSGYRATNNSGSRIARTGAFELVKIEGVAGGTSSLDSTFRLQWRWRELLLDGAGYNYDLVTMLNTGQFTFEQAQFINPGTGRLVYIKGQTQDGRFLYCTMNNGGTTDGSVGSVEIDETLSDGGHNQNLLFMDTTWEAYNGTALRIYGASVQGIPNSLIHLISCKFESPTRSNVRDIDIDGAKDITLDLRLLLGKGTGGTKAEMIRLTNTKRIRINGHVGWQDGGATLGRIVTTNNATYTKIDLDIALDQAVTSATQPEVVYLTQETGNEVKITYLGATGSQKLPTNIAQGVVLPHRRIDLRPYDALVATLARTDAVGNVVSTNKSFKVTNASGDNYFGFDATNRFAGGTNVDLSQSKFFLDPALGRATFLGGTRVVPLTAVPTSLQSGLMVMADQVTWDPLARGSGGAYWTWWTGTAWRGLHEDAAGGNLV